MDTKATKRKRAIFYAQVVGNDFRRELKWFSSPGMGDAISVLEDLSVPVDIRQEVAHLLLEKNGKELDQELERAHKALVKELDKASRQHLSPRQRWIQKQRDAGYSPIQLWVSPGEAKYVRAFLKDLRASDRLGAEEERHDD